MSVHVSTGFIFTLYINVTGNLCVNTSSEIYSGMRGHFINTICDTCSCQTLPFVYLRIFIKNSTKGLIWSTALTNENTNTN